MRIGLDRGELSPSRLSRYRAERLLRKDFAGLRAKVLAVVRSQLRGKGIALDPADLEACYAQAWHGLYATVLDGEQVENPSAWLVLVTFRRAIDEHRASRIVRAYAIGSRSENRCDPSRSRRSLAQTSPAELDNRADCGSVFEGCAAASPSASAKRPRSATCRASRARRPPSVWASARRACAS